MNANVKKRKEKTLLLIPIKKGFFNRKSDFFFLHPQIHEQELH